MKDDIDSKLRMDVFSEDEWSIIEILRREKISSVTVNFDDDRKVNLVEVTKSPKIDLGRRLSSIILKEGYETITVKTQKGKIVSCTQTSKVKIN